MSARASVSIAASLSLPLVTSFAGAQTLWWPSATAARPRVVLLFIPGNPGLSSYYIDFLHSIYTQLSSTSSEGGSGGIEILAMSHRGHAPLPMVGTNAVWGDNTVNAAQAQRGYGCTLRDQVRHKIAAVDAVNRMYNSDGRHTKVVLVGHSIGAWIAGEVLKARPTGVDGIQLLFPTLAWIGRTSNARRVGWLATGLVRRWVLPLPLLFFSLVPLWLLVWVVRLVTGQPRAAALATAELLTTPGAVANALTMAREEFATVEQLPPSTIEAFDAFVNRGKQSEDDDGGRGKVRTYWAAEDTDAWAPGWIRSQVEASLQLQRVHLPPGLGLDARTASASKTGKAKGRHMRTRSFSVSEYRSSPGSVPDLRHAKAIRKPTGEIVIQATVPDSSSDTEDDVDLDAEGDALLSTPSKGARRGGRGMQYAFGQANATSTHCRLGMPHAFCLHHSDHMAHIVAAWIRFDHLNQQQRQPSSSANS